jgi:L-cystine transport system substrate-binding protein
VAGFAVFATGCARTEPAAGGAAVKAKKLIAGVNPGSGFLAYYDDNSKLTGFEIELLRAIDERLPQYEIEFEKVEYKSMFAGLKSGRIDLVTSNLRRNAERENFLHTYRGFNSWVNRLIVLADNNTINSLEDLDGKNVGTGQGTISAIYMEDYIARTGKKINLIYSDNRPADTIAGRLDTYITADYLISATNKNYKDQGIQFKAVGPPIDTNEGVETDHNVYFFFSDGNEAARDAVSDAIYELRKEGVVSELMLEFIGEDRAYMIDESEEEKQMKELGKL